MHRKAYLSATWQPYWIFIKLLRLNAGIWRLSQNYFKAHGSNPDDLFESLAMSTPMSIPRSATLIRIFDHFTDA